MAGCSFPVEERQVGVAQESPTCNQEQMNIVQHEENMEELWDFMWLVGSKTIWLSYGSKDSCLRGRETSKRRDRLGSGSERMPSALLVLHDAAEVY